MGPLETTVERVTMSLEFGVWERRTSCSGGNEDLERCGIHGKSDDFPWIEFSSDLSGLKTVVMTF